MEEHYSVSVWQFLFLSPEKKKAVRFYLQKSHHRKIIYEICALCNNYRACLILFKCLKNHKPSGKRVLDITCVLSGNSIRNYFRSAKYSARFAEETRRNVCRSSRGALSARYCCPALIKTGNSLQILVNLSNEQFNKKCPLTGFELLYVDK